VPELVEMPIERVATSKKTRQGLKPSDVLHVQYIENVATSKKTRQGLKHGRGAVKRIVHDQLQRARKPDRD